MVGMGLWWILILVGLVALVIWAVRSGTGASGGNRASGTGSADEILRERFARGEIDEEEYRKRRDELRRD